MGALALEVEEGGVESGQAIGAHSLIFAYVGTKSDFRATQLRSAERFAAITCASSQSDAAHPVRAEAPNGAPTTKQSIGRVSPRAARRLSA